jgi:hypothetical protein
MVDGEPGRDAGGAPTVCNGTDAAPVSDPVYLYLTTNATAGAGGGNASQQPTSTISPNGLNLTAPLIAGTVKSKFIVDATGKVGSDSLGCGMNPPVFGFKKLP